MDTVSCAILYYERLCSTKLNPYQFPLLRALLKILVLKFLDLMLLLTYLRYVIDSLILAIFTS